jgi:hypothetical protein
VAAQVVASRAVLSSTDLVSYTSAVMLSMQGETVSDTARYSNVSIVNYEQKDNYIFCLRNIEKLLQDVDAYT